MRNDVKFAFSGKRFFTVLLIMIVVMLALNCSVAVKEIKKSPEPRKESPLGPRVTSNLIFIEDSMAVIAKINERVGLCWACFIDKNSNKKQSWFYLFSEDKKYKVLAVYFNFETDDEIFVLYGSEQTITIGPIGSGAIKKDFVTWRYEEGINPVLIFNHHQDFDIKTKKGRLIASYKLDLIKLAGLLS